MKSRRLTVALTLAVLACLLGSPGVAGAQPLPSWNEGPAKARILAFVQAVTDQASKDFVAPAERIAVFDNDGTLWAEQPIYFQFAFALDRVKALAPQHPEWKALDEANAKGWTVVDMKADWKKVFAFE